jgi:16S rRNA (cytosine1402-N4)-methyltransferase
MRNHIPVLLREVLSYSKYESDINNGLDCTLGLGGHASELLKAYPEMVLFAIDADDESRKLTEAELIKSYGGRVYTAHLNFSHLEDLKNQFDQHSLPEKFDLILADLGISSAQLDDPMRGLSYRFDAPLDMRLDLSLKRTAADFLNNSTENELLLLFKRGGIGPERTYLVREILKNRPVNTTFEFKAICEIVYLRDKQKKRNFSGSGNSSTVPFQALRIAVNDELSSLTKFLVHAINLLSENGRLIIISFHSGEDTLVTRAMRWWSSQRGQGLHQEDAPLGKLLTPKAVLPSEEETNFNPRSRSARLRVFERNATPIWKERTLLPTNYPIQ